MQNDSEGLLLLFNFKERLLFRGIEFSFFLNSVTSFQGLKLYTKPLFRVEINGWISKFRFEGR